MTTWNISLVKLLTASFFLITELEAVRVHFVHWNSSNPLFSDSRNNVIDISSASSPWDYEQANIICPFHQSGVPQSLTEQYVVYNVTKEEYEQCKLKSVSSAKIVTVCNTPYQPKFITLTFRSFSPTPGAFEFHPGEKYYFMSTPYVLDSGSYRRSRSDDAVTRCSHPPMRLIFRIKELHSNDNADKAVKSGDSQSTYEEPDSYVTNEVFTPREMPSMMDASASSALTATLTYSSICLMVLLYL